MPRLVPVTRVVRLYTVVRYILWAGILPGRGNVDGGIIRHSVQQNKGVSDLPRTPGCHVSSICPGELCDNGKVGTAVLELIELRRYGYQRVGHNQQDNQDVCRCLLCGWCRYFQHGIEA